MSNQPAELPLVDPGNGFLGPDYPAALVTGLINTTAGPRMAITIRCGPATLTVTMDKAAAKAWAARIGEAADNMSGLIVPRGGLLG